MNRVNLEPAFVLHTRPFRDTSLLLNVFTQKYGHLMLLARGARSQKSPLRALLSPFTPLLVSWVGKTDLPILTKAEIFGRQYNLNGSAILHGMYLNELLIRFLHRHDPYFELFNLYQFTLSGLNEKQRKLKILRLFEKKLLKEIGYGLHLDKETNEENILPEHYYHFMFGTGLQKIIRLTENSHKQTMMQKNVFSGRSLLALHNEQLNDSQVLEDADRILQSVIQELLGSKKLKSKEFI